jgi:lycopene cyclase domain-containing protein
MSLYAWLIVGSFSGPFLLSFDRKVAFFKNWRFLFMAILPVAFAFIVWDDYFTAKNVWGFNARYLNGFFLGHLPWEEIAFFFVVPYACVFIYEVLNHYFPSIQTHRIGEFLAFTVTICGIIFCAMHLDNWYTTAACLSASILTIGIYFIKRVTWYGRFAFSYFVVLLPFLLVNGALTGSFTDEPVVWYNNQHIIGTRIFTIPVEDLFYNYSLLLPITALYEAFKTKRF